MGDEIRKRGRRWAIDCENNKRERRISRNGKSRTSRLKRRISRNSDFR